MGRMGLLDEAGADISVAEQRLANVARALEAVDSGSYGTCGSCGGRLDRSVLESDPLANRCAACPR